MRPCYCLRVKVPSNSICQWNLPRFHGLLFVQFQEWIPVYSVTSICTQKRLQAQMTRTVPELWSQRTDWTINCMSRAPSVCKQLFLFFSGIDGDGQPFCMMLSTLWPLVTSTPTPLILALVIPRLSRTSSLHIRSPNPSLFQLVTPLLQIPF